MSITRMIAVFALAAFAGLSTSRGAQEMPQSWPKQGPIPTATAAISIAVKLWSPIYGTQHIANERPFHATLKDGVWTVMGSIPREAVGGASVLKIRQSDGTVLLLSHYR